MINKNREEKLMKKQGILTIVSGFSGAGKGTLMKRLLSQYQEDYCLSVSATTREPRKGETDGKEYFFISVELFEQMIETGQLLEYAKYLDNYYGTPKNFVLDKLDSGINVLLEIEMQGALKIKAQYPETLLIFILPPSVPLLEQRLRGRGTETDEVIDARLKRAHDEMEFIKNYDYIVVNDHLDTCTERIHQIVVNEQYRVHRNREFINRIERELLAYQKGE